MGVMCVTCGGWPGGLCEFMVWVLCVSHVGGGRVVCVCVSSWYECYVCHMWGVAGWSV